MYIHYSMDANLLALLGSGETGSGELKAHLLASQLAVDTSEDLDLALSLRLLLGIKQNLHVAAAILDTNALANNLSRVAQILQPVLMDSSQGAGTGTLVLDGTGVLALRLAHDTAVGNHDNGTVTTATELLAELMEETALDLLPGLQLGHGDHKDEGTTAIAEVELTGTVELQGTQIGSDLVLAVLELEDGLGDGQLEFGGGGALVLSDKLGLGSFHLDSNEVWDGTPGVRADF